MTATANDIERLVREVLTELARPGCGGAAAGPAPAAAASEPAACKADTTAARDLVVTSRLVTMMEVAGRLDGMQRLVVPPLAVVTPAVRDELQRRNVTLAHESPAGQQPTGMPRLVLAVAGKRFDPAHLLSALAKDGIKVQPQTYNCLIAATDELAGEVVKAETLGVLLTTYPAAALCLANRHPGVRAVGAADAASASSAVAAVGANVLVIEPAAGAVFQLKQIIGDFCRAGIQPCPEALKNRLG